MTKFEQYRFDCDQLASVNKAIEQTKETLARLEKMQKELEGKVKCQ